MSRPRPDDHPGGYRLQPAGGPAIRTDIVDVYVFRRARERPATLPVIEVPAPFDDPGVEFLQLLREGDPLGGTWHPVMGHVEPGETAIACGLRELGEELGLVEGSQQLLGVWALEQVYPFFVAAIDAIVLSPRLAAEVQQGWEPRLNAEHAAFRWVHESAVSGRFMWPGQIAACGEIVRHIASPGSLAADWLRVR